MPLLHAPAWLGQVALLAPWPAGAPLTALRRLLPAPRLALMQHGPLHVSSAAILIAASQSCHSAQQQARAQAAMRPSTHRDTLPPWLASPAAGVWHDGLEGGLHRIPRAGSRWRGPAGPAAPQGSGHHPHLPLAAEPACGAGGAGSGAGVRAAAGGAGWEEPQSCRQCVTACALHAEHLLLARQAALHLVYRTQPATSLPAALCTLWRYYLLPLHHALYDLLTSSPAHLLTCLARCTGAPHRSKAWQATGRPSWMRCRPWGGLVRGWLAARAPSTSGPACLRAWLMMRQWCRGLWSTRACVSYQVGGERGAAGVSSVRYIMGCGVSSVSVGLRLSIAYCC